MQVNKKDIIKIFEERKKALNQRKQIAEEKEKTDKTMLFNYEIMDLNSRIIECNHIETMISLIWDIIHQKETPKKRI